jgi:hypothetical protein
LEEAGRAMLQQMSETEGVYILDSGVILHPLEAEDGFGTGARPTAASSVKVHYHGTLPDGTVFDSSLGREPVTFALAQVIPGWKDALLNMHEGETAMIGIPAEMAYSEFLYGNVEWVVVKMIKRRTVTLCTRKKEKQVLVHWLYKNEKTWQREAEVLPQLQVHYEDLLVR